ncbi:MAG: beta-N-acetylhexosaminidase [Gammaproteobacteria bacterium RIFCSPHIGHO2_12_FULL_35_23]|nr:MAG: beta-N-acetylhexosaminidase [Gammaproteobacteria bacterium RIFCSPHIGHO2_12_FULL_35_23]
MENIGPLMIDLAGLELTEEEVELLAHPLVGGVILFSRNYQSAEQVMVLTAAIRQINPNLLIAVDQEGGRVQRFREGFTRLPAMRRLGELYDKDPNRASQLVETCGWLMAMELLAVGVDFSFAPVLDLDLGESVVIGDRAFHSDPEVVINLAQLFIYGMEKAGMASTGKHFPGHGSVALDSHVDIPIDERSYAAIVERDLKPFLGLISAGLNAIMPAHIIFPAVDQLPVGFSKKWLQTILRGQLNFEGVIFSDDLVMEGAKVVGNIVKRAELALAAGCDMLLICNHRTSVLELLEAWQSKINNFPYSPRLKKMRGLPNYTREILLENPNWQQASKTIKTFCEAEP